MSDLHTQLTDSLALQVPRLLSDNKRLRAAIEAYLTHLYDAPDGADLTEAHDRLAAALSTPDPDSRPTNPVSGEEQAAHMATWPIDERDDEERAHIPEYPK